MLQGVICDYLSQLCTFTQGIATNINRAQSFVTISNNIVIWMVISGLVVSLIAGLAFRSIFRSGVISGFSGVVIVFTAVGLAVLQSSELAFLVVIKFISISLMTVANEQDIDQLVKMGILAGIGFLLLILNTRYHNTAFPAVVTDVAVATIGTLTLRTVRYLPCLIPFIILAVILVILRNHGMGADVLTEMFENLTHLII